MGRLGPAVGVGVKVGTIILVGTGIFYVARKYNLAGKLEQGALSFGTAIGGSLSSIPLAITRATTKNIGLTALEGRFIQYNATRAFKNPPLPELTDSQKEGLASGKYIFQNGYVIPNVGIPEDSNTEVQKFNNEFAGGYTLNPTLSGGANTQQSTDTTADVGPVDNNRNNPRSPTINPTQPGSNLSRKTIISNSKNITSKTEFPGVFISAPKPIGVNNLVRGQPLNHTLQAMITAGKPIQTAVIHTKVGGTREVAGSPGLIARLQKNLSSTRASR